ncbi:MAG: ABC transporter substrate-binding protein [Chloroflexi bacterium]|nr:ABC transporter substrate-binding protein [Chloroflexota bacterium]
MIRKKWFFPVALIAVMGLAADCAPAAAPPASRPPVSAQATPAKPAASGPTATAKPAEASPKYGGTMVVAIKNLTTHFDMHQETAGSLQLPLDPAYSLLLRHEPSQDFKIRGDLAKSWEASPDGLTYTFRLNEGVRFHNGRPLTAEDIRFNFDRIISPPKGMVSPRSELYRNVLKMEAPDASTFRVVLKNPQASLLELMAMPYNFIFDPDVIKQKGDMKRDVMGTGPFRMLDSVYGVSFRVKKNENYFVKGRPCLDGATFYTINDEMSRSAGLRTRQLTALPLFGAVSTWLSLQMQKTETSLVLQRRVTPGPNSLIPNTKVAPWSDVRVRQALNLVMDRETASKSLREFQPAYGYVLPDSIWQLPKDELMAMPGYRQPKEQDVAEAKRLLAQAGYAGGIETTILCTTTSYIKEHAEFAQAQLAKIGIKATVQALDSPAWKTRIYDGSFGLAGYADASAIEDPDILLGEYFLKGSPKNYGAWSNQKFDDMYALQSKTVDTAKRKEMLWEMQRLLHQEAPRVISVWSTFYAVSWPDLKDWRQGRSFFLGNQLQDVWLAR